LAAECGEVANELNILDGVKKRKLGESDGNLGQELADVLFTLCCIANSQGVDLEKEWRKMMDRKMYGRDKDRFDKK